MEEAKRTHLRRAGTLLFGLAVLTLGSRAAARETAREPTYSLASFHRLQGLVVRAVMQDSRGFVWLGTDDGLWRWNAHRFERLNLGPDITPPVRCLLEVPHDTLWVGMQEGLVAIDIVTQERRSDTLLPGVRVNALLADPQGGVWVGSLRGLYRLEGSGASTTATLIGEPRQYAIFALLLDGEGGILAGTFGAVLRVTGGRIVEELRTVIGRGSVGALLRDGEGALWLGMRNPGALYRVRGTEVRQFGVKDGLGDPEVNVLLWHPDGDIWVATEDGVYRYVDGAFDGALSRANGLPNPDVHAMMVDFERQLWIGTYGGGVYRLRSPYVVTYSVELGVAHPFVTATTWAQDGRLIFGTVHGAQFLRPTDLHIKCLEMNTDVTAVYVDGAGEIWIGDFRQVIRAGDGTHFPSSRVYRFAEDDTGRLLVAAEEGLWRLDNEGLVPVAVPPAVDAPVQDVHVQPDGAFLLGTEHGLVRVENGSVEPVLPDLDIHVIQEEAGGRLWLGTDRGLLLWNAAGGEVEPRKDGPLDCDVRDIVQAGRDTWLACDTGVIRVREGHADRFGPEFGLPSRDVRSLAYDGGTTLYAGTTQGLAQIDIGRLAPCPARPRVVIGQVMTGSQHLSVDRGPLTLPFRQRDVVMEMATLGWQSAVGTRFSYRLLGLDEAWSTPTTQEFARFSGLAPGAYQFQAKSINQRGLESSVATVSFSVSAPFWLRPWFLALISVVGLGLVVLAVQAYRRRRQLRLVAEEAALAKSRFVSRMSHEIRTPLTAILASAEMLSDRHGEPGRRNEHVRSIVRNGRHLLALINDVLDLSRLNEGRMEPDLAPVDLGPLLDEVRTLAVQKAESRPITVCVETMPEVPRYIITDATKLRQILFNLMDNAVRFTREGAVRLEVTLPDSEPDGPPVLHFAVTDTGIGIRTDEREPIFEAFQQADSSIRRRYGGTGLGLTIARSLAELLGGRLTMESLAGTGTTFILRLPVEICTSAPPLERRSVPFQDLRLDDVRVLLVDDSAETRRVLRLVLEQFGARVVCVADGKQAVEFAAARPFDIILLDIHMPETDGIETLHLLHERSVDTPAIAITADATTTTARRCLEAGFDAFVTKPFDSAELAATIAKSVGRECTANRQAPRDDGLAGEMRGATNDTDPIESTIASISPALAEAAAEFAASLAEDVRKLDEALSQRDLETIGEIAHRLKGSGGTTGYADVSEVSAGLERALNSADIDGVAIHIRRLDRLQRRMVIGIRSGSVQPR